MISTVFHDAALFPSNYDYGASLGPAHKTKIFLADSGFETRQARWSSRRGRFSVDYSIKSAADIATLKAFYMCRLGTAYGFRFHDLMDYDSTVTGQSQFGTNPAITATDQPILQDSNGFYRLVKMYGSIVRWIVKPVANTVVVANGGTPTTLYSVDNTTGVITWSASVTSITESGTTATATVHSTIGWSNGPVTISGATPSGYNGTHTITITSPTTFTFTAPGSLGTASGTIIATGTLIPPGTPTTTSITGITESGTLATATVPSTVGWASPTLLTIAGATPSGYDGTWTITVTSGTTFTFTAPGSLGTASGTITATRLVLGALTAGFQFDTPVRFDGAHDISQQANSAADGAIEGTFKMDMIELLFGISQ